MKGAKAFTAVLLACGLLFIFIFPQSTQISLVKILKDRGPVWAALERFQIDVRQELETCFLAVADREDLAALRRHRVGFFVLDRDARQKDYFLVPLRGPSALDELLAVGRAVAVEVPVLDRLSLLGSMAYELVTTGVRSPLGDEIDLGGFQVLGGISLRIL